MSEETRFAALAFAASAAPPGYVNVVGPRRQQMLDADSAVKRCLPLRARGTPEYEQALEAFRRSPLTGCTTVLDLLRRKAGYRPATPDQQAMMHFVDSIGRHQLFRMDPMEGDQFEFDSLRGRAADIPELIRRYKGSDEEAARRIEAQLNALYDFVQRNHNQWQSSDLLLEHTLGAGDDITFRFSRSAAAGMSKDHPVFKVLIKGARGSCTWHFDTKAWPSHAEAVLQEHLKLVPDWIDQK